MENFLYDLELTINLLVFGNLNSMRLEGVASHLHQEESFPTDLAVCLAGICKVVTDLAGARVVHSVLKWGCFGLLNLVTSGEGGVRTRGRSSRGGAVVWVFTIVRGQERLLPSAHPVWQAAAAVCDTDREVLHSSD